MLDPTALTRRATAVTARARRVPREQLERGTDLHGSAGACAAWPAIRAHPPHGAEAASRAAELDPVEDVTDVRPGQNDTVFSDEELAEIRETIGLKTAEKNFEFWNNPADAVYDDL